MALFASKSHPPHQSGIAPRDASPYLILESTESLGAPLSDTESGSPTVWIGRSHLTRFLAVLQSLLSRQKEDPYDLMLGAGNSGACLLEIAQAHCSALGLPNPFPLAIPIQKYQPRTGLLKSLIQAPKFDNSVLLPWLIKQLPSGMQPGRLLVVDDEISEGSTVEAMIALLRRALHMPLAPLHITVIAGNRGFHGLNLPNTTTVLYSLGAGSRLMPAHLLFREIPAQMLESVANIVGSDQPSLAATVLLNIPSRIVIDGVPKYSRSLLRLGRKAVPNLRVIQQEYRRHIRTVATRAVRESEAAGSRNPEELARRRSDTAGSVIASCR